MAEAQKLSSEDLARLRAKLKSEANKVVAENAGASDSDVCDQDAAPNADEKKSSKIIQVEIDSDKMSATVCLNTPNEDESYTVPEVIGALRANRVVLGIKTDVIMDIINSGRYDEDIVVAEGKAEVPGEEGYFEWLIDMEKKESPDIREDGTVDYTSMNRLVNVEEGDRIAIYHPATQGQKGFDVCGTEKMPRIVKEQPRLRGKYIAYDEETMVYTTTLSGKISRNDNNIEILSVHEINDNLDATYGNVDFYGDIVINGNVDTGATIRAGRNVTVNGVVAGGKVFAGGDVVLSKGAQAKSKISARGDIFAEFIEYATLDAHGDIHANYIMNSEVNSNKKVLVDGRKATVIGGYTHGLMGIELRESGNYTEPRTELHAGFTQEDYEEYDILLKKEETVNKEITDIVAEMSDLLREARDKGATQVSKDRIYELNVKKDAAYASIDDIATEKKAIIAKMAKGTNSYIEISGDVHRNTRIFIDSAKLVIERDESCVRFVNKNNEIVRRQAHLDGREE